MTQFQEYPIFVPVGDHQIAAVVTIPEGHPRGIVLFTTGGGGALRSQRFRLWTRAARRLAQRGVASLRMEYPGSGDSTGTCRIGLGWDKLPLDDVIELANFAMSVAGTKRLGLCGNCAGARTILGAIGSLPSCTSMVLFWLKPLASSDRATRKRLRSSVRVLQRLPEPLKRQLAKAYWKRQSRSGLGGDVADRLRTAAEGRDLLLFETESALAGQIPLIMEELRGSSNGHRVELQPVQSTSMQAFESVSEQESIVSAVIEWFDASFPELPSENGREPEHNRSTSTQGSR